MAYQLHLVYRKKLGRYFVKRKFGVDDLQCFPLCSHASERNLFRLVVAGRSYIGVVHQDLKENEAFIGFARHFASCNLNVPEIIAVAPCGKMYVEQDLGDVTLYDRLDQMRTPQDPFPIDIESLYAEALCVLPRFQVEAAADLNYSLCYQGGSFDRAAMFADMCYFRDYFLKKTEVEFDRAALESDFKAFAEMLHEENTRYFMYRDFQSRNIMHFNDTLYFIDFQTGRRGPLQYDVVSLLYQARAKIPAVCRQRLLDVYLKALSEVVPQEADCFLGRYFGFVLLRMLQVLGAYGNLGLGQGKQHFIDSIPAAIKQIDELIRTECFPAELSCLKDVCLALAATHSML